jgi:hypothetical protein
MESRVREAIAAHGRTVEAQDKLRAELEVHPDALDFQFRALVPKIEKFNSSAQNWIDKLPSIKDRYRSITMKMGDFLDRKRQLGGSQDYRVTTLRSKIENAILQGPIARDQIHFQLQSLQSDFQANVVPMRQQILDLEQLCDTYAHPNRGSSSDPQMICNRNNGLINEFDEEFYQLRAALAEIEEVYQAELKSQERIIDASNRIP